MLRSKLIPMINQDKQLSVASLTIGYSYGVKGEHSKPGATANATDAAAVKFYGITKNGSVHIATGYLTTGATYGDEPFGAGDYANCTITGIPITDEYPNIRYEIIPEPLGNFIRIEGQPQLGISVSEASDHLSKDIREIADPV